MRNIELLERIRVLEAEVEALKASGGVRRDTHFEWLEMQWTMAHFGCCEREAWKYLPEHHNPARRPRDA